MLSSDLACTDCNWTVQVERRLKNTQLKKGKNSYGFNLDWVFFLLCSTQIETNPAGLKLSFQKLYATYFYLSNTCY